MKKEKNNEIKKMANKIVYKAKCVVWGKNKCVSEKREVT